MTLNRFAAALLSIAIIILTAFVALPPDQVTPAAIVQLALLGLGAVITFIVPIVDGRWAGLLKTGVAILTALLAAVLPFVITGTITPMQIIVVILAGLNALAVEIGVQIRTETGELLPAILTEAHEARPTTSSPTLISGV